MDGWMGGGGCLGIGYGRRGHQTADLPPRFWQFGCAELLLVLLMAEEDACDVLCVGRNFRKANSLLFFSLQRD